MKKKYNILFIILTFIFVGCGSPSTNKPTEQIANNTQIEKNSDSIKPQSKNINDTTTVKKSIKKYTEKEILNLISGNYIADECKFDLNFYKKNKKLNYQIKTKKRKIKGIAKILIDENGFVYILLPIEWDNYQGDMTLDTYKPNTEKKPQGVDMLFDPESKTLDFQNYGNAMNNYIIFDECDNKGISLRKY